MTPIVHYFHPALLFDPCSRTRKRRRSHAVHLHHGELDQASGSYCIWTALVILGYLTVEQVTNLPTSIRSRFSIAWRKSESQFIRGTDHWQMGEMLASLGFLIEFIKARGSSKRLIEFSQEQLRQPHLVLLAYRETQTYVSRWVIAVGFEECGTDAVQRCSAILCLDPNAERPVLVPYNARIERDGSGKRVTRLHFIKAGEKHTHMTIQLISAFALIPPSKDCAISASSTASA